MHGEKKAEIKTYVDLSSIDLPCGRKDCVSSIEEYVVTLFSLLLQSDIVSSLCKQRQYAFKRLRHIVLLYVNVFIDNIARVLDVL